MAVAPALRVLAILGDVASVIGFFLTIAVYIGLRRIRTFYVFRARVPELADRLREKASTIATLLADYEGSKQQIQIELAEVVVLARSVRDKSAGDPKVEAKQLLKLIQKRAEAADAAWGIYVQMQTLLVTLREIQLDLKWEK
jgi:hypothetical protein